MTFSSSEPLTADNIRQMWERHAPGSSRIGSIETMVSAYVPAETVFIILLPRNRDWIRPTWPRRWSEASVVVVSPLALSPELLEAILTLYLRDQPAPAPLGYAIMRGTGWSAETVDG